ncbi:MAG: hypothetical protein ACJA10_001149 [Oleispira sp.]
MRKYVAIAAVGLLTACARLDHVQIGEIDQSQGSLIPFNVQVSQFGFEAAAAAEIGRVASNGQTSQNFQQIRNVLALINMGPRTGNPVFDDEYGNKVMEYIYAECPTGKLTGLTSVREAKSLGPVSGEIVRISGYCIQ